jgi:hypothetical protein
MADTTSADQRLLLALPALGFPLRSSVPTVLTRLKFAAGSSLLLRMQQQLLHAPVQQFPYINFIFRRAGDFVDPAELL